MSFSSESPDGGMVAVMQATFDKVLNVDGYNDGIFRGLTDASTPLGNGAREGQSLPTMEESPCPILCHQSSYYESHAHDHADDALR